MSDSVCVVGRYRVPLDRMYHPRDHTWVRVEGAFCRMGMDDLGQETSGDMAQLYLLPPGTEVSRGDEIGSIEAQKFVGALRAPISGTIAEINEVVIANPHLINTDPYGEGWLVLLRPSSGAIEIADLVAGESIPAWFEAELEEYRRQGSVAE